MLAIDPTELWRQIPPEEKFELMAQAHARGTWSATITLIVFCTVAVALKIQMLVWGGLLFSPMVFQFAAGKAWRTLRPKTMLEHLAARSAARRYAFTAHSEDLELVCMLRGHLERDFSADDVQSAMEAAIQKTKDAEVWVALFRDALIMMSEQRGGAQLCFSHHLKHPMEIAGISPGGTEYSNDHAIQITKTDRNGTESKYRLSSAYPAALIVFEKKLRKQQEEVKKLLDGAPALIEAPMDGDLLEDEAFSTAFLRD